MGQRHFIPAAMALACGLVLKPQASAIAADEEMLHVDR